MDQIFAKRTDSLGCVLVDWLPIKEGIVCFKYRKGSICWKPWEMIWFNVPLFYMFMVIFFWILTAISSRCPSVVNYGIFYG